MRMKRYCDRVNSGSASVYFILSAPINVFGLKFSNINVTFSQGKEVSILDKDKEARALLEIAGKPRLSEGLREEPDDDDD